MYKDERLDAIRLIRQLTDKCNNTKTDHSWRRYRRCQAIHGLEERFPLIIELLNKTADELEHLDKMIDG